MCEQIRMRATVLSHVSDNVTSPKNEMLVVESVREETSGASEGMLHRVSIDSRRTVRGHFVVFPRVFFSGRNLSFFAKWEFVLSGKMLRTRCDTDII